GIAHAPVEAEAGSTLPPNRIMRLRTGSNISLHSRRVDGMLAPCDTVRRDHTPFPAKSMDHVSPTTPKLSPPATTIRLVVGSEIAVCAPRAGGGPPAGESMLHSFVASDSAHASLR